MRRDRSRSDVLALRHLTVTPGLHVVVVLAVLAYAVPLEGKAWGVRAAQGGEFDPSRFAPPESQTVMRGREVAARFGLGRRFELTLQVNNAFAAQNRLGIARAEALIAQIPGVRRVIGPSGLLAVTFDRNGHPATGPLLGGLANENANEVVRQRLIRRSDAIGWFVSRDGTEIRLLVETDDWTSARGPIEAAAAASGLVLLNGSIPAWPLWPEPEREPRPFPPWLPFALIGLAMLPMALGASVLCRPTIPRALLMTCAAGLAAAAPALLMSPAGLRRLALVSGAGAGAMVVALIVLARLWAMRDLRRAVGTWRVPVPPVVLVLSLALTVVGVGLSRRISVGTQLWRQTDLFFVDVRGDMDEPVVLREVRRLADFLRAEPGVAHAWSIADLFFAVPVPGENFGGIPTSSDAVRAILTQTRDDSAVRMELAPDHRETLVGVRLADDSGLDRLTILAHLQQYLALGHRSALLRVDLSDPAVPRSSIGLARGILAADTRERVLRICERSGRILSESDVQTIERAARRAVLLPVVDPPRLNVEILQEVNAFLEQVALAEAHVGLPHAGERKRLADELAAEPVDATVADVLAPLRTVWGPRLPDEMLRARAVELHRRLANVRLRHSARINFNDVLYGADLPTEGVLSEEVRDATLDAMGPIAAVPVPREVPGAFRVDAVAVGGAPCDRALSIAWGPRLALGILISSAFTASLLLALGGLAALAWWPVTLAPAAPLMVVPVIAALPVGALYVALLAGALAGGAALAIAIAPGRRDQ